MDRSFESRVWQKALDRGLLSTRQVNDCLKAADADAPTLQLTEILVAKGFLQPDQVAALRSELAGAESDAPDEVRRAARDPRNLVGRYVVVGELGRGGMGVVHRAWDGDLRRFVALKSLAGPWEAEDLVRFRREAQSAAALRHPNIVTVYEISPSDETPYIAMELVDGKSLDGRKFPPRKAAELMIVVARAVEAAHRRGIVHRDLKPHNIMLDAEGRPRVMDFGLARPLRGASRITMQGTVVGTPAYMSPEQAQGLDRQVDQRSDLFSLGAVLYELLTGQAPFGGKTPLQTLTAVVECRPVPPTRLAPGTPKPLEAVILTCLHKDRSKRYPSAEALARDLERFLNEEPVLARVPRSKGPLIAAASAAVAFAVAAAFLLRPGPEPPAPVVLPKKPAPAVPDRRDLDAGLQLLEEARLDAYRAGINLSRTREKLLDAERAFSKAIGVDPENGAAWLGRGEARSQLNRGAEAMADLERAIRLLPSSPAARQARGRILLERFMSEMISASWMAGELPPEILQGRDQAITDFRKARELQAPPGEMAWLEACLAWTEERYDDVLALSARALPGAARPEEYHKLCGDAYAARFWKEAKTGARRETAQSAVDEYTRALELRQNYADVYHYRGAMLFMAGRAADALKDYETQAALLPDDSQALSDLGTIRHYLNDPRATHDWTRAIAADPANYRALTNRATTFIREGRYEEAKKDLETALRHNPHHLAAQYNRAVALQKLGDRPGAIRALDEILARKPDYARARVTRAVFNYENEQWQAALDDFERAAALDPAAADPYRTAIDACRKRLGR